MKGTMKAIAKLQAAPGLTLIDAPIPQPGPGEVLIKVHKTAICGTDLHIYNWDAWSRKNIVPPLIIGHEYVGEIAELGPNVDGLTVGERVSGEGHIVCHHCRNCRAGNGQWCKFTKGVGVNRDGAFAARRQLCGVMQELLAFGYECRNRPSWVTSEVIIQNEQGL